MPTTEYISNPYPQSPVPGQDYSMTAVGDHGPSEQAAQWRLDKARQGFLANLTAKKAALEQNEWMEQRPIRLATDRAALSKANWETGENQNKMELQPLQQKQAIIDAYSKMDETKRTKLQAEFDWFGKNGEIYLNALTEETDPALKNGVWRQLKQAGNFDDSSLPANWTPQNEKKLKMLVKTFVIDKAHKNARELKEMDIDYGLIKEEMQGKTSRDVARISGDSHVNAAKEAAGKPLMKIPNQYDADGNLGILIVHPDMSTEFVPAPKGTKTPKTMDNERKVREAQKRMKDLEESNLYIDTPEMLIFNENYRIDKGIVEAAEEEAALKNKQNKKPQKNPKWKVEKE
ncbi:MAG: hypothetical protein A3F67_11735 [Verrucomicrobia bacterium RIFCSPHIGHO2_12_FULL_41_10]|nr:MAG: hypothetical protein A3F67_11735 [Verrucomicrobia bacterium RIFCSPHIGHO2_12_FULL_41_10]